MILANSGVAKKNWWLLVFDLKKLCSPEMCCRRMVINIYFFLYNLILLLKKTKLKYLILEAYSMMFTFENFVNRKVGFDLLI